MTNQASEDELRESIDTLLERWRKILTYKGDGNGDEYYQSDVIDDIQEIIRTEKLKLLAEVRERVVGEDYDIPAEMEKVGRDFQQLDAIAKTGGLLNKFKADLRTKLTKLEAEL